MSCTLPLNNMLILLIFGEQKLNFQSSTFKGRSRRLRPKAHILDDPGPWATLMTFKSPLRATLWPLGPNKGPLLPFFPLKKLAIFLLKKEPSS